MELGSTLSQMAVALLVVVGLMILLGIGARRWPLKRNQDSRLRVVSSISVGSREKLVVVTFDDQQLLLGVTPQSINALCAAAPPRAREAPPIPQLLRSVEEAK